jgi:uncharacterized protein YfaQ (DUF2300 family)
MKIPFVLLAAACVAGSCDAIAQSQRDDVTFHTRTIERYCEKLRESAPAYVQLVRRLAPIHGYTYYDFAPAYPGAPVKADCRATPERVAEVRATLHDSVLTLR